MMIRVICLCALLAGCGIKGDLVRPSQAQQETSQDKKSNGLF